MQRLPSIHKYCNRWCERCPFQGRCGFYLAQQEGSAEIDWSEGLEEKIASARPHPFQALDLEEAESLQKRWQAREKAGPFDLEKAPLKLFYKNWQKQYAGFLKELKQTKAVQELEKMAFLEQKEILILDNALQVLKHYQRFVGPKITRALGGKHDELNMASSLQSDWNGSAKVAVLALKHIRLALEDIVDLGITSKDPLIEFLGNTNRIIKLMYFDFPDMDQFQRPGFDDLSGPRRNGAF